MRTLLIAYDISEPARLRKVAQLLEDHGKRLQQSVFACRLPPDRAEKLVDDILALIDRSTDRLIAWPICGKCTDEIEQYGDTEPLPGSTTCYVA